MKHDNKSYVAYLRAKGLEEAIHCIYHSKVRDEKIYPSEFENIRNKVYDILDWLDEEES